MAYQDGNCAKEPKFDIDVAIDTLELLPS